ncbi:MAG: hypothetical protein KGL46_09790 [Hyphomicrobiales bacterium]|nr:hypothetical protein [Hyphomicrobiales bacterium]
MTSHKIGEWRDSRLYDVRYPDANDRWNSLIVGTLTTANWTGRESVESEEVLFTTCHYAGPSENMLDAFDAGFHKGFAAAQAAAQATVRKALGLA